MSEKTSVERLGDGPTGPSALDTASEAIETELAKLATLLEGLANWVSPTLLTCRAVTKHPLMTERVVSLRSAIPEWRRKLGLSRDAINELFQEMDI